MIPPTQKGLLEDVDAHTGTGETIWRETGSDHGVTQAKAATIAALPPSCVPSACLRTGAGTATHLRLVRCSTSFAIRGMHPVEGMK